MTGDNGDTPSTPPNAGEAFNTTADPPPPTPPAPPPPAWTKAEADALRSNLQKPEPTYVLKPGEPIQQEVNKEAMERFERNAARLNYIEQARAEKQGTMARDFGRVKGSGFER
jgi:hypothetical protein